MRRAPVQRRSAERVERILDAAARLLDESGYEGLSTRRVAAVTGLPIGSVYRYFRDKRELADALAARNLSAFVRRVRGRGITHWEPLVEAVVDEYLEMKRTVPGFAVVDFGANAEVAEALAEVLAVQAGLVCDRGVLLVAVEAADALLRAHHDEPHLIAETKAMLRAYLALRLDQAAPVRPETDGDEREHR
ncbi:TetR/AcrR family transcriptional regulator [Nonomuraea endophytica]|uniref:TetR/AcrR family transcriptional regulator n=1 Tax=Nonomuraea endophytica TaxID=714136 RepID=UPI0037CC2C4C